MLPVTRRRHLVALVLALLVSRVAAAPQLSAPAGSPSTPMFAGVTGDGTGVNFAWWAVKGATGYELVRTPNPQQRPITIGAVSSTTLGHRDNQPAAGPQYYALVAILSGGVRATSAWFLYYPPAIGNVSAEGADTVISWSEVPAPPGGYEVWRSASPQQRATRVGAVSKTTLTYRDRNAGAGPYYYQVIAVGAGGTRAASPWVAFNVPATAGPSPPPTRASAVTSPATATPNAGASSTPSFDQVRQQIADVRRSAERAQWVITDSQQQREAMAKLLAEALANAGLSVSEDERQALVSAMTSGGNAAMAMAVYFVMGICDLQDHHLSSSSSTPLFVNPLELDQLLNDYHGDPVAQPLWNATKRIVSTLKP